MRKITALIILFAMLFVCSCTKVPSLEEENGIEPRVWQTPDTAVQTPPVAPSLAEKMASLSFVLVSGKYVRRCIEDDMEYTEMFLTDKSSFVRTASDESEEEVFAYNYKTDRFTYLYYFEGELLSKVVYDLATGTVVEDTDDLAELLIPDAVALKQYFTSLLQTAGIGVEELE